MEINTGIVLSFVFSLIAIFFLPIHSIAIYQKKKNKGMMNVFGEASKYLVLIFGILGFAMFIFACFEIGSFITAKAMMIEIPKIIWSKTIEVFTH